jgi:rhodanese-related sulfurtransferase
MFFREYELGCLALYSYVVGDTTSGRAVVVDPHRDVSIYLADATANGLRIERVLGRCSPSSRTSGRRHTPPPARADNTHRLHPDRATVVFCASRNRSSIAASLLGAQGLTSVADVLGGFGAWATAGLPVAQSQR